MQIEEVPKMRVFFFRKFYFFKNYSTKRRKIVLTEIFLAEIRNLFCKINSFSSKFHQINFSWKVSALSAF